MKKIFIVILYLSIPAFGFQNSLLGQTTYSTTVIENKKSIHPRLYLDQVGINQLKTQITSGKYKTMYDGLITLVKTYKSAPTAPVAAGPDLRGWGDKLFNLSIAYKLSGNTAYLSLAENYATYLMTAPDSYYATPALEPGHHLIGLAVFYDWCFSEMNATVKSNLVSFVNTKGNLLNTWLNSSVAGTKWYLSNQLTSRMTGLGTAALAFYECFDTKAWISTVMSNFILVDSFRGNDGGFVEGVSYGGYDLDFQMRFFDLSKTLLSYNFYNSTWWSNSSMYQVYMSLPYNSLSASLSVIDIGDSPRYLWYGPNYLLRGIAREKSDGYAQQQADMFDTKNANYFNSAVAYNLLRYDATVAPVPFTNLPTLRHFDNYGIVTARDSWSNNKSVVSFTCGPALGHQFVQNNTFDAGSGHSHPNANSFSIFHNGEFLIRNAGYVLRRTDQENTLLVDSYGQLEQPITLNYWISTLQFSEKRIPAMLKVESNADFDIMVGDATKSYAALSKYERTLIYIKPNVVLVLDNIQSATNHNYELLFHTEQTGNSVTKINNLYKVRGAFTDLVIHPLTTVGVLVDTVTKAVKTRNQAAIAYRTCVLGLKNTTNNWMNAIAFSWNDKNLATTDVSLVSKNGNVWLFQVGNKYFSYDWLNKSVIIPTSINQQFSDNIHIPIVSLSNSGQKKIDLLIKDGIKAGSYACIYSINGVCLNKTNIICDRTQIQLSDSNPGIYILKVVNGNQMHTFKIMF